MSPQRAPQVSPETRCPRSVPSARSLGVPCALASPLPSTGVPLSGRGLTVPEHLFCPQGHPSASPKVPKLPVCVCPPTACPWVPPCPHPWASPSLAVPSGGVSCPMSPPPMSPHVPVVPPQRPDGEQGLLHPPARQRPAPRLPPVHSSGETWGGDGDIPPWPGDTPPTLETAPLPWGHPPYPGDRPSAPRITQGITPPALGTPPKPPRSPQDPRLG